MNFHNSDIIVKINAVNILYECMLTLKNIRNSVSSVRLPDYNLPDITPGIVHFGVGNFFRAHEALDHHVIELRKIIRNQGVHAALATLPA